MYKNAIFDVDGTLLNSFKGVSKCLLYAAEKIGKPPISDTDLRKFLGPSLTDSFKTITKYSDAETAEAIKHYRGLYETVAIKECELFDGAYEILEKLKADGVILSVASSKPRKFIKRIFDDKGITHFFDRIEGPDLEKTSSEKVDLILAAKLDDNAVMIGDRKFDIIGARQAKVDVIGVTFGFAPDGEFDEFPPDYIAKNFDEVYKIITSK